MARRADYGSAFADKSLIRPMKYQLETAAAPVFYLHQGAADRTGLVRPLRTANKLSNRNGP